MPKKPAIIIADAAPLDRILVRRLGKLDRNGFILGNCLSISWL